MLDINCKDLQLFGGTIIGPPSLQILRLFGTSSRKLSGAFHSSWPYGNQAYIVHEADPRQQELE
jgi:hypothetical protein